MCLVPFKGTALGFGYLARSHSRCHPVSIYDRFITGVTSVSRCGKVEPHVGGLVVLCNTSPVAVSQPELQLCHSRPLVRR